MSRIVALASAAFLPACAGSFHVAQVRVAKPASVTVAAGKVVIPAGSEAQEVVVERWPNIGPPDVVRRTASGAIELEVHSHGRAYQRTLVDGEGRLAPIAAQLLPERQEDVFRIGGLGSNVTLATPWSNVQEVTVQQRRQPVLGWLAAGVGTTMLAGGSVISLGGLSGDERSPLRDLQIGGGAAVAGVGLVALAVAWYFLTTPARDWTWKPPAPNNQ